MGRAPVRIEEAPGGEREWERADEIAAIADDLLFPRALRERLQAMRRAAGRG